jgi:transcriptional regulator with XRE-family HTH domain
MVRRIADGHYRAKGRELARLRKASGLSQEQLATRLGISPKQLGKYERARAAASRAGRYDAAMAILREYTGMVVGGFSEGQAPYAFPASVKDTLLRTLRFSESMVKTGPRQGAGVRIWNEPDRRRGSEWARNSWRTFCSQPEVS